MLYCWEGWLQWCSNKITSTDWDPCILRFYTFQYSLIAAIHHGGYGQLKATEKSLHPTLLSSSTNINCVPIHLLLLEMKNKLTDTDFNTTMAFLHLTRKPEILEFFPAFNNILDGIVNVGEAKEHVHEGWYNWQIGLLNIFSLNWVQKSDRLWISQEPKWRALQILPRAWFSGWVGGCGSPDYSKNGTSLKLEKSS